MTPKQKAAHERNWRIFCLRGMYNQFQQLECKEGMLLVDKILGEMGAIPETAKRIFERAKQDRLLAETESTRDL